MLEDVFTSIMSRVGTKYKLSQSYEWKICLRIMKKLEKEKNTSRWWQAVLVRAGKYCVKHGVHGFVVNLLEETCSCRVCSVKLAVLVTVSCFTSC